VAVAAEAEPLLMISARAAATKARRITSVFSIWSAQLYYRSSQASVHILHARPGLHFCYKPLRQLTSATRPPHSSPSSCTSNEADAAHVVMGAGVGVEGELAAELAGARRGWLERLLETLRRR
jgi:hypothetical protein